MMLYKKLICIIGVCSMLTSAGFAQQHRSKVMAGAQVPLQFTAAYQHLLHPKVSVRGQAGIMTHPLDKIFLYSMERSGLDKNLSQIIKESFKVGYLATAGSNYHFNKYYAGIYVQYGYLRGQGRLTEALYMYYRNDLPPIPPQFQPLLDGLQIKWQSNIFNAGVLAGREFLFANPKFSLHTEIGLTKTFASASKFSSSNSALNETPLADQIFARLDSEFKNAFRKYGYYPSINIYAVYNFK